jgi:CIC family chloride channel protein
MVFESEALIYTVIAAVTAYALHGMVVGWDPIFAIPEVAFDRPAELAGFVILGIAAGVVAAVLPRVFEGFKTAFRSLPGPPHLKPAVGGLAVGLIGMAFPATIGTGYGWMEMAMAGTLSLGTMLAILALKPAAMSLTIASGGSGGVFGPTVVIGGMLGGVVGTVLAETLPALVEQPAAYVVVGMASVFAAAARTPISTLIMTAEMTGGYALIVPTMLANVLAFLVQRQLTTRSRHPTLYDSQVETREDSPAHRGVFVRRAMQVLESGDVDPSEIPLPRLVKLLQYGEALQVGHGAGLLVSVLVAPGSELEGKTVSEAVGPLSGASAVAVLRGEEMLVPRGPTLFRAGDQVILLATPPASQVVQGMASAKTADASEGDTSEPARSADP